MEEEKNLTEKDVAEPMKIKDKKARNVIRRRKPKTEKPIAIALHLLVESGKVEFGGRKGIKNAAGGKVKAFILSRNTTKKLREDISNYCKKNSTQLVEFEGSSLELGSACGKPFSISVISVFDQGSSNILDMAKAK